MEVLTCVLCDSAANYGEKLCILGTFDTLVARGFPVTHPHCALAMRLVFRPEDEGHRKFTIRLINSDGQDVFPPLQPELTVRIPPEAYFLSRNLVITIQDMHFANPGQFSIDVLMDDELVARTPFQVLKVQENA